MVVVVEEGPDILDEILICLVSGGAGNPGVLPPDHVHLLPDTGSWYWHWELPSRSFQVTFQN